jgi:hypothetical protein
MVSLGTKIIFWTWMSTFIIFHMAKIPICDGQEEKKIKTGHRAP